MRAEGSPQVVQQELRSRHTFRKLLPPSLALLERGGRVREMLAGSPRNALYVSLPVAGGR